MRARAIWWLLGAAACGHPAILTDGGAPDLETPPTMLTGTRVAAGELTLYGVTSDGYAAAIDAQRGALAIPLDGTAPRAIDPAADALIVSGAVIFSLHDFDPGARVSNLTVWSAAGSFAVAAAAVPQYAASADGRSVLVTRNLSANGASADLVLAAADGSSTRVVLAQVSESGCRPFFGFFATRFVVGHCAAGSSVNIVSSVDPSTGAVIDLQTAAERFFSVDPAGTQVLVADFGGNAFRVPIGGGPAALVTDGVDSGVLAPDGSALVFGGGALRRVSATGQVTPLVAQGLGGLVAVAPDFAHLLYRTNLDPLTVRFDLSLASTTVAQAPAVLSSATDAAIFGDAFTTDGTRALYLTAVSELFTGTFQSRAVVGGDPVVHGAGVWAVRATSGTRVVFNDHFLEVPKHAGRADLYTLDTAGGAPSLVATRADARFALTKMKDRVVYTFSEQPALDGLYVAPAP